MAEQKRGGPRGHGPQGHGFQRPKDFRGTVSKLLRYIGRYKAALAVVFICLATMFIKQHSAVDFFVALPVCLLAEGIAYGKSYWAVRWKKRRSVT